MIAHAEARSIAASHVHPASIQTYDRVRERMLFKYRADVAAAKAVYHGDIAHLWRAYGRPVVSAECKADMHAAWSRYLARLRATGQELDAAPERALSAASLCWRQ